MIEYTMKIKLHEITITGIAHSNQDALKLEERVTKLIDNYYIFDKSGAGPYAENDGQSVHIYPPEDSIIFEVSRRVDQPAGTLLSFSQNRWMQIKIDDVQYNIDFNPPKLKD